MIDNEQAQRIVKMILILVVLLLLGVIVYFTGGFVQDIPDEWPARTKEFTGD